MLEIKKFKNVYGIKDLKSPELIKDNTIIYAPNAVMKSSFSQGINDIKNGKQNPKDVIFDVDSEFEILVNSNSITNSSQDKKFRAIVFSDNVEERNVFEDPKIATLIMSTELRKKYESCLKKNKEYISPFTSAVQTEILNLGRSSPKIESTLMQIYGGNDIVESIINIPINCSNLSSEVTEIPYPEIFNETVESITKGDDFKAKVNKYIKLLKKEFDSKIFLNGFDFNGLIALFTLAKENGYFAAGHKFYIDGCPKSETEISDFIEKTTIEVYETKEIKLAFESTQKLFNKKGAKELGDRLSSHKGLVELLADYEKFRLDYVTTSIVNNVPNRIEIQKNLLDTKREIDEIISQSREEINTWIDVLRKFESRFTNRVIDIQIPNEEEVKIGRQPLRFIRKHIESDKILTSDIEKRFSTGEKRTILILNMLFEIEIMLKDNAKFLVIFDDIIDSFDYKNKYAVLEYLKELVDEENIQLIILTHNFDFYRSCRLTLGERLKSKLLAYSKDRIITLYKNEQSHFDSLSFFNDWKNNKRVEFVIPLIPFIRNIEQLKGKKEDYEKLCKFVHYSEITDSLRLSDIQELLVDHKVKLPEDYDDKPYIDHLDTVINGIILKTTVNETELSTKINLGLYLRLNVEKYLWMKHVSIFGEKPKISNQNDRTGELFKIVKNELRRGEIEIINSCLVVSPSFVHINSFM